MALARFSIIAGMDRDYGISKGDNIPWEDSQIAKFFNVTTTGRRRNAVIIGRRTYELLLGNVPLEGRTNIVISRKWQTHEHPDIIVHSSILEALEQIGSQPNRYDEVFIMGGCSIFDQVIRDYMYLCDKVYISRMKISYGCTHFFPFDQIFNYPRLKDSYQNNRFTRDIYVPNETHSEYAYLNLVKDVLDTGEQRNICGGVNTVSKFGCNLTFDISQRLPIITTRCVKHNDIVRGLLFLIGGTPDVTILENEGVDIYSRFATNEAITKYNLNLRVGDLGPTEPFQLRHFGSNYQNCFSEYSGTDQLKNIINGLKTESFTKSHVITLYNPTDADNCARLPTTCTVQFYVTSDKLYLDCSVYQSSADLLVQLPFDIGVYALLLNCVAHVCGYTPRNLHFSIGDAHIHTTHLEAMRRQSTRTPKPFPVLKFSGGERIFEIDQFTFENFDIQGYNCWQHIAFRYVE